MNRMVGPQPEIVIRSVPLEECDWCVTVHCYDAVFSSDCGSFYLNNNVHFYKIINKKYLFQWKETFWPSLAENCHDNSTVEITVWILAHSNGTIFANSLILEKCYSIHRHFVSRKEIKLSNSKTFYCHIINSPNA